MKKLIAVALLDCRRLGFGLVSAALVGGLLPSLGNGLGAPVPAATILIATFVLVGASCGGYFGNDFSDGRSSFFFARPLPTWALIGGRVAALLALAGAAFLAFMASNWVSTTEGNTWTAAILEKRHAYALTTGWAVSLFVSLGIAARARDSRGRSGFREIVLIPLRLGLSLTAFLLMFGLFADLIVRAYTRSFRPIEIFLWSWIIASLVASFVAIAAGRTERLRIARLQTLVMGAHFVLVSLVIGAAWTYVLHPGPEAIESVTYGTWGSPDGKTAYVTTKVGRGDGSTFTPVFVVDIASGEARRLNSDQYQGPWTSADGATVVWSEATPFFFRPLWRRMGGATTFTVKTRNGDVFPLPMPQKLPDFLTTRDLSRVVGSVNGVVPSNDADVFAIFWDWHLTFTSRSRGELSDVVSAPNSNFLMKAIFVPSGDLRTVTMKTGATGKRGLEVTDVEPVSGKSKTLISLEGASTLWFDSQAARALVVFGHGPGRGSSISLVQFDDPSGSTRTTPLLSESRHASTTFLADGRIVAIGGGDAGGFEERSFTVFAADGKLLREVPFGSGGPPRLGTEIFPGVVSVNLSWFVPELSLVDVSTGQVVRRLPNFELPATYGLAHPATGASARLLQSRDGKLYELPALDAEPRLLLPLPKR